MAPVVFLRAIAVLSQFNLRRSSLCRRRCGERHQRRGWHSDAGSGFVRRARSAGLLFERVAWCVSKPMGVCTARLLAVGRKVRSNASGWTATPALLAHRLTHATLLRRQPSDNVNWYCHSGCDETATLEPVSNDYLAASQTVSVEHLYHRVGTSQPAHTKTRESKARYVTIISQFTQNSSFDTPWVPCRSLLLKKRNLIFP